MYWFRLTGDVVMFFKNSIYGLALTALLCSLFSVTTIQAQARPVCQSASSDSDGDGYGWENRAPCIVTEQTSAEPAAAICLDDDGVGWGWDGLTVCRVDVMCYDTAPIGDGWGWNGSASCENAAFAAPFSELATLKSQSNPEILFNVEIPAATAVCGSTEYRLYADGTAESSGNGQGTSRGRWSTGFEDSDGLIHLSRVSASWLILTNNSVSSRVRGQQNIACSWQ